ncbi:phage holin family protein, partial [Pseudomonas aeruginosa]|nr:phage holin family protein [Pseudomonas aeruginosa]
MVDPLSTLTVLVCSAICMRLITYRRAGARFRPGVSLCAYLLALCTGCQALGIVAG